MVSVYLENVHVLNVRARPHAPGAQHAEVLVADDGVLPVGVGPVVLLAVGAVHRVRRLDVLDEVLDLARLRERVDLFVPQKLLERYPLLVHNLGGVRRDHHPVADVRLAGLHKRGVPALNLHEAHPAAPGRRQVGVVAEGGDVDPVGAARFQDGHLGGNAVHLLVDGDLHNLGLDLHLGREIVGLWNEEIAGVTAGCGLGVAAAVVG